MTDVVRLGFVGAGGIARAHAGALSKLENAKIVAVTDVSQSQAEALAQQHGAEVFESPAEMIKNGGVDAVMILVPPFAHGDPEKAALAGGIPFFIEKPVGLDEGLTKEITSEVEKKGLLTSVGYMNRYRRSVQRVKQILQSEPAILAYGGWWGGSPGATTWWTDKSKSGGQFHEQVTHTVDLARYFLGEPAEVYCVAAHGFNQGIPGYSMDDAVTVAIRFKNGGIANLMSSVTSNAGGGVSLNLHSLHHNFRFTGWEHSLTIERKGDAPEEIPGEDDIFAIEDRAFVSAVQNGDRSAILCSYPDGARSTYLSLAANRSIETGKPVEI